MKRWVVIAATLIVAALIARSWSILRSYNHLEERAAKVVDAATLQKWATNLIASNPTGANLVPSNWGAGFPTQLLRLAPEFGPHVAMYEGDASNSPPWVRIAWGSGFAGLSGFEIGPTNFVTMQPGHAWAAGVYFFKR